MADLSAMIADIKTSLDRVAEIDPTPENAMMIKGELRSIRDRLERAVPPQSAKPASLEGSG